ncbi:uncharacterized protein LOC6550130 [Drosophila erecta]|uniref:F-box domain-containing protein n=1 Tax=Drosophila erecta TaxID=7220 RepID=B3NTD5_DROER|nr:uncharacterized protein LOC6550130 [Drosophila erecta]EDV46586.2 uncharacterized protein Dere_GG19164 [Drosophila erecta]
MHISHFLVSDICQFDDFWLKVAQWLDLKTLISLASTCDMLEDVYRRCSKRLCRTINVEDLADFTEIETKLFVHLSGSDIQYLCGGPQTQEYPHFAEFIRLMSIRPTKVTEIAFTGFSILQYHWIDYVPSYCFSMLTSVKLIDCHLKDEGLLHWNFLPHLKSLDLRYNKNLTGSFLQFLPASLEALNLSGCKLLCPSQLANLSQLPRLRELRALDLKVGSHCHIYRDLVRSCPGLEGLELSVAFPQCDEYHLGELRSLQTLHLEPHSSIDVPIVVSGWTLMALMDVKSLECLKFSNAVNGFISAHGLAIISMFCQLRVLYIPNQPYQPHVLMKLKKLVFLEALDLTNSPFITDETVVELVLALPNLSRLKVMQCPLLTDQLHAILAGKLANKERPMIKLQY